MKRRDRLRTIRILAAAAVVLITLGGCTSGPSGGGSSAASVDPTPSPAAGSSTRTTPSSPPAELADCSRESIESALPKGSVVKKFDCAVASPAMWAAARVKTGSVYFLTSVAGPWEARSGKIVCAKTKNVPKELRGYCVG